MNRIIKAPHWKIFAVFLAVGITYRLLESYSDPFGPLPAVVGNVAYSVFLVTTIGWILITGRALELNKYKTLTRTKYKMFICVGVLLIVIPSAARLFLLVDRIMDEPAIYLSIMAYLAISLFWIVGFTAKALKSNETSEEIDINDYFGDIFLVLLWPIGIWVIQPRINKVFENKIVGHDARYEKQ